MDTPRPFSPPRSATRLRGESRVDSMLPPLSFTSPTKPILFSSPESRRLASPQAGSASGRRSVVGTRGSAVRSPSSVVAQTPASSFSSKLRKESSPTDSISTVSSASKINRMFSDYEKQKELDDTRFSMRLRELEDERNRAFGETETLLVELDKARQLELRARKENDELKEKLFQIRKDIEVRKREEEGNRRLSQAEVEELKRSLQRLRAEQESSEKELQQARQIIDSLERELHEERDLIPQKVDAAVKRALELERTEWEKDQLAKTTGLEEELFKSKQRQAEDTRRLEDIARELADCKKQLDRVRRDSETERAEFRHKLSANDQVYKTELEGMRTKLSTSESFKRKLERELDEFRLREQQAVVELQSERERNQERLDLACRRVLEKEREEVKLQQQAAGREEERKRKEMEEELDDAKTRLAQVQLEMIKLEKAMDDMKKYAERVQTELEAERQAQEQRIENTVRRAVEKEQSAKATAMDQLAAKFQLELDDANRTIAKLQESCTQAENEVEGLRKQVNRLREAAEQTEERQQVDIAAKLREEDAKRRVLQLEIDQLKKQLAITEQREKRTEKDMEDLKNLTVLLEEELDSERRRSKISSEAACKRAVEKERLERRTQMEQLQRDEEKRRKQIEKELEETKMKLYHMETQMMKTQKELEMHEGTIERQRLELDQAREALHDEVDAVQRRSEKEQRTWTQERQDLNRLVQDLEQHQLQLVRDKESLLEVQEDHERDVSELQNQLKEAAIREERLLLDIAELRGRNTGRLLASSATTLNPSTLQDMSTKPLRRPLEPISVPSFPKLSFDTTKPRSLSTRPLSSSAVYSGHPVTRPLSSSVAPMGTIRPRSSSATPLARRVANAKRYIDSDWM